MTSNTTAAKSSRELLTQAVNKGDAAKIRALLANGSITTVPRTLGRQAICIAVHSGYEETVRRLLKAGADPNPASSDKLGSAYLAVLYKHPNILRDLLKAGANPNGTPGYEPIFCAVNSDKLELLEILIAAGVRLDAVGHQGANALQRAAEFNREDMLKILLEAGLPADSRDHRGQTAMHYAARAGDESTFQILLDHGADIEARTECGLTPALHAAAQASLDSFETLVRLGANPLAVADGKNAFDLALRSTHIWADEMAAHLLTKYPILAPTGEALDHAFVEAVRNGYAGTAAKLAQLGADVGQKPNGRSLIQCAPKNNDAMKRLLRSLKLGGSVESAMDHSSDPHPSPNHSGPIL